MGKGTLALNTEKTVWAPQPVRTVWRRGNLLPLAGNRNTIPRLSSSYPSHNTDRATPALLWSVTLYSYCPTGLKGHISARPMYSYSSCIGLKGHNISGRLVYSYCPSIGLKGHNISTDSGIPTVPRLDWRGTVFLQIHVFLLSRYWTEGAQYVNRFMYSCCSAIGLKGHSISTDSCIPAVPLLDWRGTVYLQTHVFLLSRYWAEGLQYVCKAHVLLLYQYWTEGSQYVC